MSNFTAAQAKVSDAKLAELTNEYYAAADAEKKVRDLTYFRNQLSDVEKRADRGELSAAPTDVRILETASE